MNIAKTALFRQKRREDYASATLLNKRAKKIPLVNTRGII
jgi:hypothetical protein